MLRCMSMVATTHSHKSNMVIIIMGENEMPNFFGGWGWGWGEGRRRVGRGALVFHARADTNGLDGAGIFFPFSFPRLTLRRRIKEKKPIRVGNRGVGKGERCSSLIRGQECAQVAGGDSGSGDGDEDKAWKKTRTSWEIYILHMCVCVCVCVCVQVHSQKHIKMCLPAFHFSIKKIYGN